VFDGIVDDFEDLLRGRPIPIRFPITARLHGDNVITHTAKDRTPWFPGTRGLLEFLETVEVDRSSHGQAVSASPSSWSFRPDDVFRGYAGQIASGYRPRRATR